MKDIYNSDISIGDIVRVVSKGEQFTGMVVDISYFESIGHSEYQPSIGGWYVVDMNNYHSWVLMENNDRQTYEILGKITK